MCVWNVGPHNDRKKARDSCTDVLTGRLGQLASVTWACWGSCEAAWRALRWRCRGSAGSPTAAAPSTSPDCWSFPAVRSAPVERRSPLPPAEKRARSHYNAREQVTMWYFKKASNVCLPSPLRLCPTLPSSCLLFWRARTVSSHLLSARGSDTAPSEAARKPATETSSSRYYEKLLSQKRFHSNFSHEPLHARSQNVNKLASFREAGRVVNIAEWLPPMRFINKTV